MKSFLGVLLLVVFVNSSKENDFLDEEIQYMQHQLDHYAKTDPAGLESLRNSIEAALLKNSIQSQQEFFKRYVSQGTFLQKPF